MRSVGFIRLAIVLMALLMIALLIPTLTIHHFSPYNSGVASVIGGVALAWMSYSVIMWIAEGFKK